MNAVSRFSPFFFLVLFVGLIVEGAVRHLPLPAVKLDLIWLGVLFAGFFVPLVPGGLIVLILGLVQESFGAPFHGVLTLSYLSLYLLIRLVHQHIFFQRRTSQVVWVALLSLGFRGLEALLLLWQGYEVPTGWAELLGWAFLQGFASLAAFPLFRIGGKTERGVHAS